MRPNPIPLGEEKPWGARDATKALRRVAVNPTAKPQRTDNPLADANAYDGWRREREEWKGTAQPVVIVDVDLPLSSVFALIVQITIIQLFFAAVVVAVLYFAGAL